MEGIQSVQQLDDTHVQWVAEIRGESRQWTTEITEKQPDEKIAPARRCKPTVHGE